MCALSLADSAQHQRWLHSVQRACHEQHEQLVPGTVPASPCVELRASAACRAAGMPRIGGSRSSHAVAPAFSPMPAPIGRFCCRMPGTVEAEQHSSKNAESRMRWQMSNCCNVLQGKLSLPTPNKVTIQHPPPPTSACCMAGIMFTAQSAASSAAHPVDDIVAKRVSRSARQALAAVTRIWQWPGTHRPQHTGALLLTADWPAPPAAPAALADPAVPGVAAPADARAAASPSNRHRFQASWQWHCCRPCQHCCLPL